MIVAVVILVRTQVIRIHRAILTHTARVYAARVCMFALEVRLQRYGLDARVCAVHALVLAHTGVTHLVPTKRVVVAREIVTHITPQQNNNMNNYMNKFI